MTPIVSQPDPAFPIDPMEEPDDARRIVSRVLINWKWFLLSILVALCAAFLLNRFSTKVYEVSSSLLLEADYYAKSSTGTESLGTEVFKGLGTVGSMRNIYNQVVVLNSSPMVERAIEQLNFEVSYFSEGRFTIVERYKDVPFRVEIDKNNVQPIGLVFNLTISPQGKLTLEGKGKNIPIANYNLEKTGQMLPELHVSGSLLPGARFESDHYAFTIFLDENFDGKAAGDYRFVFHSHDQLVNQYKNMVSVILPEDGTSILEVSIRHNNVAKATDFLNKLTEVYTSDNLDRKNKNATRTIDFINDQLVNMSDSLLISQDLMQQFQTRTKVMNISLQTEQLLEQMNDLDKERVVLETKNKYYNYLKNYISSSQDLESVIAPSAMGIDDQLLNNLIMDLNKLVVSRSSLASSVVDKEHPQLRATNAQIENIKGTLLENANSILAQTQITLDDLGMRLQRAQSRVNALPATERNYVNIERKYKLYSDTYTFLLQKYSEAQIAKASNFPDSEVIEAATFKRLVSPNGRRNYMFALILGMMVPAVIIFGRNFVAGRIVLVDDLRMVTQLPILGYVMQGDRNGSPTPMLDKPNSSFSEAYRAIRGKLNMALQDKEVPVIAVASTFPGEGKTYNAINIASSFALRKKRTVLLDLDLRNSQFRKRLGIKSDLGVTNYILGTADLDSITSASKHPNLWLIPAGPQESDPGELLADEKVIELLHALKRSYDVIVIDNLPVGLVADLFQLREEIDATVFVVRHRVTKQSDLRNALGEVAANRMKGVGLLINGISRSRHSRLYGYNCGYIYGQGPESPDSGRRK